MEREYKPFYRDKNVEQTDSRGPHLGSMSRRVSAKIRISDVDLLGHDFICSKPLPAISMSMLTIASSGYVTYIAGSIILFTPQFT